MKKFETRDLVYIAMYVALAIVLDYIKEMLPFLNMPQGGSINIALLPVVIGSFHLGWQKGAIVGLLWWLVSSLLGLNPEFLNIGEYLLDYIIPSAIVGCAAIFFKKRTVLELEVGIFVTMAIRTLAILTSGAYFWPGDAASGSMAAWVGSLSYNLPYCLASAVMLMIVVPIVIFRIKALRDHK